MKIFKVVSTVILILFTFQINAQEIDTDEIKSQKGFMNAKVTHTLAYVTDGVERPYTVTVRERRTSTAKFNQADLGKVDQNRIPTPENVAVLITISNPFDASDNRVISMRYDKQVNDAFELKSNANGFYVSVDGKKLVYTMGDGMSFPNSSHLNYFKAEEFDVIE